MSKEVNLEVKDKHDFLHDVLYDFCNLHNIEIASPEEILEVHDCNDYQKQWLKNFIEVFDTFKPSKSNEH